MAFLCGQPGADFRKIDVSLRDVVDIIGQHIQRDIDDDFDDAGFVEICCTQRRDVGILDHATGCCNAAGKLQGGVDAWIF